MKRGIRNTDGVLMVTGSWAETPATKRVKRKERANNFITRAQ